MSAWPDLYTCMITFASGTSIDVSPTLEIAMHEHPGFEDEASARAGCLDMKFTEKCSEDSLDLGYGFFAPYFWKKRTAPYLCVLPSCDC